MTRSSTSSVRIQTGTVAQCWHPWTYVRSGLWSLQHRRPSLQLTYIHVDFHVNLTAPWLNWYITIGWPDSDTLDIYLSSSSGSYARQGIRSCSWWWWWKGPEPWRLRLREGQGPPGLCARKCHRLIEQESLNEKNIISVVVYFVNIWVNLFFSKICPRQFKMHASSFQDTVRPTSASLTASRTSVCQERSEEPMTSKLSRQEAPRRHYIESFLIIIWMNRRWLKIRFAYVLRSRLWGSARQSEGVHYGRPKIIKSQCGEPSNQDDQVWHPSSAVTVVDQDEVQVQNVRQEGEIHQNGCIELKEGKTANCSRTSQFVKAHRLWLGCRTKLQSGDGRLPSNVVGWAMWKPSLLPDAGPT